MFCLNLDSLRKKRSQGKHRNNTFLLHTGKKLLHYCSGFLSSQEYLKGCKDLHKVLVLDAVSYLHYCANAINVLPCNRAEINSKLNLLEKE